MMNLPRSFQPAVKLCAVLAALAGATSAEAEILKRSNNDPGLFDASSGTRSVDFSKIDLSKSNLGFKDGKILNLRIRRLKISVDFAKADGEQFSPLGNGTPFHNETILHLTSPAGTRVDLIRQNDFLTGTLLFNDIITFDDKATHAVNRDRTLPRSGESRPVSRLSALNGQSPFGIWTLFVADAVGADALRFRSFTLEIIPEFDVIDTEAIYSVYTSGLPVAQLQREALLDVARATTGDINGRLFRLRSGINQVLTGSEGPSGKEVEDKKQVVPEEPFKRFELFAATDFNATDLDQIGSQASYDGDSWSGTVGFEYHLTRQWTLGLGATYIKNDTEVGQKLASFEIEGFAYTPYVSWTNGSFYADALYSLGLFSNDIRRSTLGQTAKAQPDSVNHTFAVNAGYNLKAGQLITGPFASLDYVRGKIEGYTENNGGRGNLSYGEQNYDSLISHIGWQASLPIRTTFGLVVPQVRASWGHEYRDDSESVGASLTNSPVYHVVGNTVSRSSGGFSGSTRTQAPGADFLSVGAGVMLQFGDRTSIYLNYAADLFQQDKASQSASAKVSVAF